jgi:hypothetical protein
MTSRKRIVGLLSATLFVATMAFAATPPPPTTPTAPTPPAVTPTPPPVQSPPTQPTTPAATTPTLLWVYGDPTPQWLVLGYFQTEAACDKSMTTIGVVPPQEAGCFPVGVDPARLHDQYGSVTATPVAK